EPLLVLDQFRLLNHVLTGCRRLTSFRLNSFRTETQPHQQQHFNLNQIVLSLLAKYGHNLTELCLENLISADLYHNLAQVLLISCPKLAHFRIDSGAVEALLDCVELQLEQLVSTTGKPARVGEKRLKIEFIISNHTQIETFQKRISSRAYRHLNEFVQASFRVEQR